MDGKEKSSGLVIPIEKLSEEALHGLIDEFILREGTDYGHVEYSLEHKHQQVLKQLEKKHILIVYDLIEETTTLIKKDVVAKTHDLIHPD